MTAAHGQFHCHVFGTNCDRFLALFKITNVFTWFIVLITRELIVNADKNFPLVSVLDFCVLPAKNIPHVMFLHKILFCTQLKVLK